MQVLWFLSLLLTAGLAASQFGDEGGFDGITAEYALTLQDLINFLENLIDSIKKEGILAAKAQIEHMRNIHRSEELKNFEKILPESWQGAVKNVIDEVNKFINLGVNKMISTLKDKIKILLVIIKDKAGANPVVQTLTAFLRQLQDKSLKVLDKVKKGLLKVLENLVFKYIETKLSSVAQNMIRLLRDSLRTPGNTEIELFLPNSIQIIKDRLVGLRFAAKIKGLLKKAEEQVGVAKDMTVQKIMEIVNPKEIHNLNMIPEYLPEKIKEVIEETNTLGEAAAERLRRLLQEACEMVEQVIKIGESKSVEVSQHLLKKLAEARELIKQTRTAAQAGQKMLLEVLNSESFQKVLALMPQWVQDRVAALIKRLEPKVDEIVEFYIINGIVKEITQLFEIVKSNVGAASDIAMIKVKTLIEQVNIKKIIDHLNIASRAIVQNIVHIVNAGAKAAVERLKKRINDVKIQGGILVGKIKKISSELAQQLKEVITNLLKAKTIDVIETSRQALIDLLESEAVQNVINIMSESVQAIAEQLKKLLR